MAAPRKENVQKLILDTTERLLKAKSSREISLSEIARQAHVAKGTLYYYYPSREDLFMALLDRYLTSSWQELVD
jgi:AcrR family transcriptional regulator